MMADYPDWSGSYASTIKYDPFHPPGATRVFTFVPEQAVPSSPQGSPAMAQPAQAHPASVARPGPVTAQSTQTVVSSLGTTQTVATPTQVFNPPGSRPEQLKTYG